MRLQLRTAVLAGLALSTTAHAERPPVKAEVDTFVYTDTDNVLVISPQVGARAELDDEGSQISARATIDIVSAASVDVITEATSRFSETREEANLSGAYRLGEWLPSLALRYSSEPDYHSAGGVVGLERRLGYDTTLQASYGFTHDDVLRSGTPSDVFSETLTSHAAELSATQVLDTRTVLRLAYSFTAQDGYMEKPYRYVPLFDQAGLAAAEAQGVTLDADSFGRFRLAERPGEEVPDQRLRHAFALRGLRYLPSIDGSLRADYRFYLDDWGLTAHTGELALRKAWGRHELSLADRVHWQSSADFWRRVYVVEPGQVPRYRTVDKDLSRFFSQTAELGFTSKYARWSWYLVAGMMWTRFDDYMFLDSRIALTSELGLRLNL